MALDIFSTFDDHNKIMSGLYLFMWAIPLLALQKGMNLYSTKTLTNSTTLGPMTMTHELVSRTATSKMGGSHMAFMALISMLLLMNLSGMAPYVFSMTSHLAINLCIALPFWFACILMGASFNLSAFLSHFQPAGSPAFLNPFLCIIELVSNLVRPFTLAVRLTANLSTGHILMGLLGTAFAKSSLVIMMMITGLGLFYFIFEFAVCAIQAYIFTLLPTLYADEHPQS